jgi:hypothetical protein
MVAILFGILKKEIMNNKRPKVTMKISQLITG